MNSGKSDNATVQKMRRKLSKFRGIFFFNLSIALLLLSVKTARVILFGNIELFFHKNDFLLICCFHFHFRII